MLPLPPVASYAARLARGAVIADTASNIGQTGLAIADAANDPTAGKIAIAAGVTTLLLFSFGWKITKPRPGAPNAGNAPKPGFRIVETDGNTVELLANTAKGDVTVITEMTKQGDDLLLTGLHIDGPGAGSLGLKDLLNLAKDFGKQQGAKRVTIQGGIRTTGANPGHTPRPITICVD